MIAALAIWLFKRYILPAISSNKSRNRSYAVSKKVISVSVLLMAGTMLYAHEQTATYLIRYNGDVIGKMFFQQQNEGADTYFTMTSQVRMRLLFNINLVTSDRSHFSKDRLMYSEVYRSVNGKEKENKKTKLYQNYYQLQSTAGSSQLRETISYNMMMLYCKEPVNIRFVYSDNFQQFLPVTKKAEHVYRIELPDGNYNDYHFRNGICSLVVLYHSFYTIKMELV